MWLTEKLLYDDAYGIAIRKCGDLDCFYTRYPSWNYWYADPFLCYEKGAEYVFVEAFDYFRGIGRIAVAEIRGNDIKQFKIVIKEKFHMSFPNIFKYKGIYYMIPETSECGQLRLYKCVSFPYEWKLERIILQGRNLVDPVLLFLDEENLLINSYDITDGANCDCSIVYNFANSTYKKKSIVDEGSHGRAAGNIYYKEGVGYRCVQNCELCYGDYITEYRIEKINDKALVERPVADITVNDITFDINRAIRHMHTYNNNGVHEVVDFRYRKYYPLKVLARAFNLAYKAPRIIYKRYL